jgi:hypothetical protein
MCRKALEPSDLDIGVGTADTCEVSSISHKRFDLWKPDKDFISALVATSCR